MKTKGIITATLVSFGAAVFFMISFLIKFAFNHISNVSSTLNPILKEENYNISNKGFLSSILKNQIANVQFSLMPEKDSFGNYLYRGTIHHIFFHSLLVYPEIAYANTAKSNLYRNYMITRDQFKKILPQLYEKDYILIDINSIYKVDENGKVTRQPLYLPKGKIPLIISIDDLSYYRSQYNSGIANKLVLDGNGGVATEIITPEKGKIVTRDGDIVPILDDFIKEHPDFSLFGAKGLIALTGYDGILGYRVKPSEAATSTEAVELKNIIGKLKKTGWTFASHSYYHDEPFFDGTISLERLKEDTRLWDSEVKPFVGETSIFVGPFGQIFKPGDPRREFLISHGFKMLCGVGMDMFLNYYDNYVMMDRVDIDGFRIIHNPELLSVYFNSDLIF